MKNLLRNLGRVTAQSFIAAMAGIAVVSMAMFVPAFSLTSPPTFGPRQMQTQQTAYFRINILATGSGISANGVTCAAAVTGGGNCSVKVGALPYNAFLIRAYQQIITSFNATTTDTIGLGTASGTGNQNIVAAQSVHGAAGGATTLTIVSANVGIAATGNGIAATGTNGGFDLFVTYVYTTTNIATAGQAVIVLEFIPSNDGTCVDVPLGSTGVAC